MPPAPSSRRPWIALTAGVVIVLAVLGVVWWTVGSEAGDGPALPATVETVEGTREPVQGLPEANPSTTSASEPLVIPESEAGGMAVSEDVGDEESLTVFGTVEDPQGEPLADIEVNLFDDLGEYLDSTYSNADGSFAMAWDEPLDTGWAVGTESDFLADPDDPEAFVPATWVCTTPWLPGDPPFKATLVLGRAPLIRGLVRLASSGAPVDLGEVEAVSLLPGWVDEFQDTFTEEDGSFAMRITDIPSQELLLRVVDDDGRVALEGPFDLAPGEERFVELVLEDPLTITGVVRAVDGTPVDGAELTVMPLHDMFDSGDGWDITWDDGLFEMEISDVPSDRIWLYVETDEYGPVVSRVLEPQRPVEIVVGGVVNLSGRIRSKDGEAVEDADVRVVLRAPMGTLIEDYEDIEYSDDEGFFSLDLEFAPPGFSDLVVEAEGFARYRRPLSELVPTERDWRAYEVEVELTPATSGS